MNLKIIAVMFLLTSVVIGCSNTKKEEVIDADPGVLYSQGNEAIVEEKYKTAISRFEAIEREHPASDYAAEASVRKAYALYSNSEFDEAIYAIEDFLRQYPADSSVPYMYYLRAICYYEQIVDVGRDQQLTKNAMLAFDEVIERFPGSRYAKDAKLKRELAFNQLAGKEMEIGMFYMNRGQLTSAINRFKTIVEQYDTSIFTAEALYRLTEIYYAFGARDQAEKYASVLGYNYPNSKWYVKAYELVKLGKSDAELSTSEKIISKIW